MASTYETDMIDWPDGTRTILRDNRVDNLPDPMVYRGTLGTGGTITTLPVDGSAAIGDTYKVITAGTYAGQEADVGDMFICHTKTSSANTWDYVPSGDDPPQTASETSYANGTSGLAATNVQDAIDEVVANDLKVKTITTSNRYYGFITDAADGVKSKDFIIDFLPARLGSSGTPSPDNVRNLIGSDELIMSVANKNIFDMSGFLSAEGWVKNSDGSYTGENRKLMYNNYNAGIYNCHYFFSATETKLTYGQNVTWSFDVSSETSTDLIVGFSIRDRQNNTRTKYIETGNDSGHFVLTTDASSDELVSSMWFSYRNVRTITISNMQIEVGTTETTYEQPIKVDIVLPQTVYSGTYNATTGDLTIDYGYVEFDGSSDEVFGMNDSGFINHQQTDMKIGAAQNGWANWLDVHSDSSVLGIRLGASSSSNYMIFDKIPNNISEVTDIPSWRTYLSTHPLQVVYPLANPIVINIGKSNIKLFSGNNYVSTSNGNLSLTYYLNNVDSIEQLIKLNIDDELSDTSENAVQNKKIVEELANYYTKTEVDNKFVFENRILGPSSCIAFNDGGNNVPLKSITSIIIPIRSGSGTESPTNIRNISGTNSLSLNVCSELLYDKNLRTQGICLDSDGEIVDSSVWNVTDYMSVDGGSVLYYWNIRSPGNVPYTCWYDSNKQFISSFKQATGNNSISIPNNAKYIRFSVYKDDVDVFQCSLDRTIYTMSLPEIIYAGEIECVYGSGKSTHKLLEFDGSSDENWNIVSGTSKFYINVVDMQTLVDEGKISNMYPYNGMVSSSSGVTIDKSFYTQRNMDTASYNRVWVYDSSYTTVSDFKTALATNKLQVLAEMVTPTSITITPNDILTLSGNNSVFFNTYNIKELCYFNNKTDELANLIRLMTRT